jgi:hypothetical protein
VARSPVFKIAKCDRPLLLPPPEEPGKKIGFDIKEHRAAYGRRSKKKAGAGK